MKEVLITMAFVELDNNYITILLEFSVMDVFDQVCWFFLSSMGTNNIAQTYNLPVNPVYASPVSSFLFFFFLLVNKSMYSFMKLILIICLLMKYIF